MTSTEARHKDSNSGAVTDLTSSTGYDKKTLDTGDGSFSGASSSRVSHIGELRSIQCRPPTARERVTISAWRSKADGPSWKITYHDGTVSHNTGNKYVGPAHRIQPCPGRESRISTERGEKLGFKEMMTSSGRPINLSATQQLTESTFEPDALYLRPADDGKGYMPWHYDEDKALEQLLKDKQLSAELRQLPMSFARITHLESNRLPFGTSYVSAPCKIEYIFSGRQLPSTEELERGKVPDVPPAPSTFDGTTYEEEHERRPPYGVNSSYHTPLVLTGTPVTAPKVDGVEIIESQRFRDEFATAEASSNLFNGKSVAGSESRKAHDVTIATGWKNNKEWMSVKYDSGSVLSMKSIKSGTLSTPSISPFPVRDKAWFPTDRMYRIDDPEAEVTIENFCGMTNSPVQIYTTQMIPPAHINDGDLTFTDTHESQDSAALRGLDAYIRKMGPKYMQLSLARMEVEGLLRTPRPRWEGNDNMEIPVSITYTYYDTPTPTTNEGTQGPSGDNDNGQEVAPEPYEPPPAYEENAHSRTDNQNSQTTFPTRSRYNLLSGCFGR